MEQTLINYGALGVMVLILVSLVYYLLKDHREERKEWRETLMNVIKENSKAIQDFTVIVTVLKTMLEDRKRG